MSTPGVAFSGMGEKALPFLKALGFHQNREWFHENKALYEAEVKQPLGDLIEHLSDRMEAEGLPYRGSRKTSLYRVNRDVRFSKNKDPYNTHASALMTRNGTKKEQGFVYVHMANERSFIASGFYSLQGEALAALRRAMVDKRSKLFALIDSIESKGYTINTEETLKRLPRGFDGIEDERLATLVKLKHFHVMEYVDNAILTTPGIADKMVQLAHATLPLVEFGWAAIDPVREAEAKKNAE